MQAKYSETEMSRRARQIIQSQVHPESVEGQGYRFLKYDPEERQRMSLPSGEINPGVVYRSLGSQDQIFRLAKRCITLNLTNGEANAVLRVKAGKQWGKGYEKVAMNVYRLNCEELGLIPEERIELPEDWYDKMKSNLYKSLKKRKAAANRKKKM